MISIITPCLNGARYIRGAIESVMAQDYPRVEHIVVDGGSTDGTLDILKDYAHLRWFSEPDRGLYDALNKGINRSRGEIIGHLNSDDRYETNIFSRVLQRFRDDSDMDAVYGGAVVFERDESGEDRIIALYDRPENRQLSLQNVTIGVPITNARFFHKRVYERIGLYDITYRIAGDREFLLRAILANLKSTTLNRVIYQYRQHPRSMTIQKQTPYLTQKCREYLDLAEKYMGSEGIVPAEVCRFCAVWHGRVCAEMTLKALLNRSPRDAWRYWVRGWGPNNHWPLSFLSFLAVKVLASIVEAGRKRRFGPETSS